MVTYFVILLFFFVLYIQFAYLSLSPIIYGVNIDEFASDRNTVKKTITASRGTIYDSNDNILALNVSSYTVIAYLKGSKSSRGNDYVEDIQKTAETLSPVLGMEVDALVKLLSYSGFQVELGPGGRGITELKKDEIKALNLAGIDFIATQKRYYPNGDFASYIIGYAKDNEVTEYDDDNKATTSTKIVGELGIEGKYNNILTGTNGYLQYQQDKYGYKIANTKEISVEAENGYNIYLTIDSNIQRFIETEIQKAQTTYNPEWITISVMDAKTGKILGSSATPSFDPNILNITNYQNPLTSQPFEPGSTMKIYTYMCAMENGVYDGSETYMSGSFNVGEDIISDWNKYGWGEITFDKGFEYSSNVGIANLITRHLTKAQLKDCLTEYGFGKKTGIELSGEQSGTIKFNYDVELLTAGFGQGITTTPIQHLQALSVIANNGKMLTPHIVDKIVNPNNGDVYYKSKVVASEQLVTTETVTKIKQLMYNVIQGTDAGSTGYPYRVTGLDVIGKTGTSQIYSNSIGSYLSGENAYIFSFAGMYPNDDPEIIVYAAMKLPTWGKSRGLYTSVKAIMESIAKYKNMYPDTTTEETLPSYKIGSYINKNKDKVIEELNTNKITPIIIGDGSKIIKQSFNEGTKLIAGERLILVTNSTNYKMPNISNFSRAEVIALCKLLNLQYNITGYGYVTSQSIPVGTTLGIDSALEVVLTDKIVTTESKES